MATVLVQRKLTTEELVSMLKECWNFLSCNLFQNSLAPGTYNPIIKIDMKGVASYLIKQKNFAELEPREVELAIVQIFKEFKRRNPDIVIETFSSTYEYTRLTDFRVEWTVHVVPRHVPSVGLTD